MTFVLAWNNVRANRTGLAASFVAVVLAVMLIGGSGLLVAGAASDDELNGIMGLLIMSAVVSGFVSIFVVAGMLSMHVLRQRRTWGLLRSVGMTPRQVRGLVRAEALVVAVLATAAGCLLAMPYALTMAAFTRVAGLAPGGVPVELTPVPFVVASVAGVAVTLLAARSAARKAVRMGPLEVLRDSAVQGRLVPWPRAVAGVVALAGGFALLWLLPQMKATAQVPAGLGATMALCVAGSALGPVVLRGIGALLGAPVAWLDPGAGMIARSALIAQPRRAMSAASPVMLTVALACTFLFAVTTSDAAAGVTRTGAAVWAAPLLVGAAVAYTVIAVVNATALSMAERAAEIRLLRSVGTTPGQLARAVCWESLIVTCAGALLGTGIAAVSLAALGRAMTGEPWFAYSLPQYAGLVLVCVVSGLAGGLAATRKARLGPLLAV
ncbi:putative ABC transport system permease protein [Nonomuraea solani]|uniref:Putative ABC transport system permease protein n=1 Tax=Nonomuraea solani TaxID=1144553 RepID=A0A1H6ETB5_9ACTN|nr:ABC transporter permease [Nonomuraea solani]SEH00236.1 putative ABC transport system permease protein [Nonomuraea solani]